MPAITAGLYERWEHAKGAYLVAETLHAIASALRFRLHPIYCVMIDVLDQRSWSNAGSCAGCVL